MCICNTLVLNDARDELLLNTSAEGFCFKKLFVVEKSSLKSPIYGESMKEHFEALLLLIAYLLL